jgi:hypothetical protein
MSRGLGNPYASGIQQHRSTYKLPSGQAASTEADKLAGARLPSSVSNPSDGDDAVAYGSRFVTVMHPSTLKRKSRGRRREFRGRIVPFLPPKEGGDATADRWDRVEPEEARVSGTHSPVPPTEGGRRRRRRRSLGSSGTRGAIGSRGDFPLHLADTDDGFSLGFFLRTKT